MKKLLIVTGIGIGILSLLGIAGIVIFITSLPEKRDYLYLQNPRIIEKSNTKALMVNFDGDPNIVIKEAFGSLFKVYYKTKGAPKIFKQPPPVARYEFFDELFAKIKEGDLKSVNWKGFVAVPVPDKVMTLPDASDQGHYPVELGTLEYGMVCEVVHFGAYETEGETIGKLLAFVKDSGYTISGLHEEEYIKGPGMPFRDPENYITIIRYQVTKIPR